MALTGVTGWRPAVQFLYLQALLTAAVTALGALLTARLSPLYAALME